MTLILALILIAPQIGQIITTDGEVRVIACPTAAEALTGRDLRLPYLCPQPDQAGRAALSLARYTVLRAAETRAVELERAAASSALACDGVLLKADLRLRLCKEKLIGLAAAPPAPTQLASPIPAWAWVLSASLGVAAPLVVGDALGQPWSSSLLGAGAMGAGLTAFTYFWL